MYNLTNVTDATNFYEQFKAVNMLSDYLLGVFILLIIFIVSFIIYKKLREDTFENLIFSSAATLVVTILMWVIELVPFDIVIYPSLALLASVIMYRFGR